MSFQLAVTNVLLYKSFGKIAGSFYGFSLLSTKQKRGVLAIDQYSPVLRNSEPTERSSPPKASRPSPLVPLKQVPRVHLVRHVRELVASAIGDDHVAAGLEGLQLVGHLCLCSLRSGPSDHWEMSTVSTKN